MEKLLMIPGPIVVSDAVTAAFSVPPPSHLAPHVIEAFGSCIEQMRKVWLASGDSQPFIVAGSGTLAMEMAALNVIGEGARALVVDTGYFSERMAEMLRRAGAEVELLSADVGQSPSREALEAQLPQGRYSAVFATHVDTSTGVRVDAQAIAAAARAHDALSVFDGVCATAAERFEMEAWGADIYLTASQKAIGLPAGLTLLVASPRALAARSKLRRKPPMSVDFEQWLPIMQAYEARAASYFSTPATNLVLALDVSLREQLAHGMDQRFAMHQRAADGMRAAWDALGLSLLGDPTLAANTLSAIRYPDGVDAALVKAIAARGVIVAGGLHPKVKASYFRVGHMGVVIERPDDMIRTIHAVAEALAEQGHTCDAEAATAAYRERGGQSD